MRFMGTADIFILYDRAGRPCVQGTTKACTRSSAVNPVSLGRTANGMGGYVAADPRRVTVDRLESVTYYDDYSFMSLYGRKAPADAAAVRNARGYATGVWSRLSDNTEMLEVMTYDALGRVTVTQVYGPYGHNSTTETAYHYSSQPQTVKYTEGQVSSTHTNSYTYSNASLYESVLTLNGSTHKLCRNGYDDLGHLTSVERGYELKCCAENFPALGEVVFSRGFEPQRGAGC